MRAALVVAAVGTAVGIAAGARAPRVSTPVGLLPAVAPGWSTPATGGARFTSFGSGSAAGTQEGGAGVTLTVNGVRRASIGRIVAPKRIVVDNGRFRLIWYVELCEAASIEADVKVGDSWKEATARCVGDWLYPGGPVQTLPTEVEVLRIDSAGVAIRLRFGDHWIRPRLHGFPSWYVDQPYPFHRTVWLRPGEYGYFTEVVIEKRAYFPYPNIEHEIGFGGLWGPALVRTTRNEYRTESQREDFFSNLERVVDAAEFTRDGDRLARVLVPLGPQPMISPVFASSYGGVYLYGLGPTARYGAYVYAAPTEIALPARAVCRFAWRNAPFALPVVSNPTLEACGPTPQRGTPPG